MSKRCMSGRGPARHILSRGGSARWDGPNAALSTVSPRSVLNSVTDSQVRCCRLSFTRRSLLAEFHTRGADPVEEFTAQEGTCWSKEINKMKDKRDALITPSRFKLKGQELQRGEVGFAGADYLSNTSNSCIILNNCFLSVIAECFWTFYLSFTFKLYMIWSTFFRCFSLLS